MAKFFRPGSASVVWTGMFSEGTAKEDRVAIAKVTIQATLWRHYALV